MTARLLPLTLPLALLPLVAAAANPADSAPSGDWIAGMLERAISSPAPQSTAAESSATRPGPPPADPEPPPADPEPPPAVQVAPVKEPASGGRSAGGSAPAAIPQPNLRVNVENLRTGKQGAEAGTIKVRAPFPAKPLATPPPGWHFELPTSVPPLVREVELAPGSRVALTIRPHVLVPDTDGTGAFAISEPGLDPALGYRQTATVGAVLATAVRQLDEDAKRLGQAIDQLQQLLITLPKPPPVPEPTPAPAPPTKSKPAKNR
jgi:hypothetical protein